MEYGCPSPDRGHRCDTSSQDRDFLPAAEIVGDIGASLDLLRATLKPSIDPAHLALAGKARGINITEASQIGPALREGLASPVPFFISIPVDSSENIALMEQVHADFLN